MSENKDIDMVNGVPVAETVVAEEAKPKAEAKAEAPAVNADATVDYWANAWANRGV
jgi:hypothetical protein